MVFFSTMVCKPVLSVFVTDLASTLYFMKVFNLLLNLYDSIDVLKYRKTDLFVFNLTWPTVKLILEKGGKVASFVYFVM